MVGEGTPGDLGVGPDEELKPVISSISLHTLLLFTSSFMSLRADTVSRDASPNAQHANHREGERNTRSRNLRRWTWLGEAREQTR